MVSKYVDEMIDCQPGKAYRALRRMAARPGDNTNDTNINIISHQNESLTTQQSADRILQYFSSISQQYEPLDITKLHI